MNRTIAHAERLGDERPAKPVRSIAGLGTMAFA